MLYICTTISLVELWFLEEGPSSYSSVRVSNRVLTILVVVSINESIQICFEGFLVKKFITAIVAPYLAYSTLQVYQRSYYQVRHIPPKMSD